MHIWPWLRPLLCLSILFASTGCGGPTQFQGDAHYPGGPKACRAKCEADGMTMSAFVYSGEFATSCVCRPRAAAASPASLETRDDEEVGIAAAAGVVMQIQRHAEQARRLQNTPHRRTRPIGTGMP